MTGATIEPGPNHDLAQARAEHVVARNAIVGAILGAVLCAPIWVGLVSLALVGKGTALGAPLGVAAGIGVFAGVFFGGSAGTLLGARTLERVEHESRPPVPTGAPREAPGAGAEAG